MKRLLVTIILVAGLFPIAPGHGADPTDKLPAGVRWQFQTANAIAALALSPDGKTLAVGDADRIIQVYDLATGRLRHQLEENAGAVKCLVFSPDGARLASASSFGRVVLIWDPATGKELHRFKGAGGWVYDLAFSPDGKLLADASTDSINLHDVAAGKKARELEADGVFGAVAFAPDGNSLAAVSTEGPLTLHRWDVQTGKPLGAPANSGIEVNRGTIVGRLQLAFLLHGRQVMLGGPAAPRLIAWDAATDRFLSATPLFAENNPFALLPDGRTMVVPGTKQGIALREVLTLKDRRQHLVQDDIPHRLALSADGRTGASGTGRRVYVWELPSNPRKPVERLDDDKLQALWRDLAGADAVQAADAIDILLDCPRDAVPFLAKQLRPAPAADPQKLARLVADLDAKEFAVRQKAGEELVRLGELADEALRAVLAGKPTLEVQRRIEQLLPQLVKPYPITDAQVLQPLRAVETLERIGTPEAKAVLEKLAKGAGAARLTLEAKAAVARLDAVAKRR